MGFVAREGYDQWTALCQRITDEKWRRLEDNVRIQMLWLTAQLVSVKAKKIESLLSALLRTVGGGQPATGIPIEHLRTATHIATMFAGATGAANPNRTWLLSVPHTCAQLCYHYLRILQEPLPADLRSIIIKFVLDLFNDNVISSTDTALPYHSSCYVHQ